MQGALPGAALGTFQKPPEDQKASDLIGHGGQQLQRVVDDSACQERIEIEQGGRQVAVCHGIGELIQGVDSVAFEYPVDVIRADVFPRADVTDQFFEIAAKSSEVEPGHFYHRPEGGRVDFFAGSRHQRPGLFHQHRFLGLFVCAAIPGGNRAVDH